MPTLTSVLPGLAPGNNYDIRVIPRNKSGSGPPSSQITIHTPDVVGVGALKYRGLNALGADQSDYTGLISDFPHANTVIVPFFLQTSNQTSTNVSFQVDAATSAQWIVNAKNAGFNVFVAVYLNPADGSVRQTITPGRSFAGVQTFMANLKSACVTIGQLASARGALGMWCGVELQPWAGSAAGDTGPFNTTHMAEWKTIYSAVKAIWPTGVVSNVAMASAIGLADPTGPWSAKWDFWDAIVFNVYPDTSNSLYTTADFKLFETTQPDADAPTAAAMSNLSIWEAFKHYSLSLGRKIIINEIGIIPAVGNQAHPSGAAASPPPSDYVMQGNWFQAQMDLLQTYVDYFDGFFAFSAGRSLYSSPYTGTSLWGVRGTSAGAVIDAAYATLASASGAGTGAGGGGTGGGSLITGPIVATPGVWETGVINGMNFKFLRPNGYDPTTHTYPAVLFLHQLDNASQIPGQIDPWFNTAAFRSAHPCFVVAPMLDQSADHSGQTINWGGVTATTQAAQLNAIAIMKFFIANYAVDADHVYVTGNDMGATGAWDAMIKYNSATGTVSRLFEAGLMLGGTTLSNGYPQPSGSVITALKDVPLWAIHGELDTNITPDWDRNIYAAIQAASGAMIYTEVSAVGHDVWDTYYPQMTTWDWLFSQ